jgi:hypothetical protein
MHFNHAQTAQSPKWSITHANDRVYLYRRGRLVGTVTREGDQWTMSIYGQKVDGGVFESWQQAVNFLEEIFP